MVAKHMGDGRSAGSAGSSKRTGSNRDPLMMSGLGTAEIEAQIAENSKKVESLGSQTAAKREERLQRKEDDRAAGRFDTSSKTPNTSFKAAPPPEEPPPIDKSHYLDKIAAYKERFSWLKSRNKLSGKASEEEVMDELAYIETQLGSGQSDGNMGCMLLHGAMSGLEASTAVWNPLNLQLQGLGDVTKNNMDRFKPIVDELVIKYTTGMYMGPEMRLVLHVGALVMTVHAANTGSPALSEALNRAGIPVAPSVADTDL